MADGPTRIGRHEVLRELGRGGMGVVYEVRDPDAPQRRLALKLLRSDAAGEEALRRFEREVELLARVRHVNVVAIHTTSWAREGPYLVMDLVDGRSPQGTQLPAREAARVVRALCDAVAAVHAQGVLHRDLKPANVLLRPGGAPLLLDFGLARELAGERLTRTGQVLGSPRYLAPESITDRAAVDARTDVYGLGAVLFELLGGEAPYTDVGGGPVAVMAAVVSREPRWPTAPAPLAAILRRAMARAPGDRPPTVAALAAELDGFLAGRAPARTRARAAVAALLLAAVVAGGLAERRARSDSRRSAEAALTAAAAWDERTLVPWGLGLGAGPAPDPTELEGMVARLTAAAPALPEARRAAGERRLARLTACARRLGGAAPRPGATSDLVASLEATDLALAVRQLGPAAGAAPEWPLVRAELELRALRAGPDAGPAVAALPSGALEGAAAAAFVERKAAALRDPAVARRWAEGLLGWVVGGSRRELEALALLRRLVPATARAAAEDEAALLAGVRARLEPTLRAGSDEAFARALSLDACLRASLAGTTRWALRDLASARLDRGRRAVATATVARAVIAAATGDLVGHALLRRLTGVSLDTLLAEPERSRLGLLVPVIDPRPMDADVRFARAAACLDAPVDDLHPVFFAQAHEQLLAATVARLRAPSDDPADASDIARARASARVCLEVAREHQVGVARLSLALQSAFELRCLVEGRARAPAILAELERELVDAPVARSDWAEALALSRVGWLEALTGRLLLDRASDPQAVAILTELGVDLARRALASGMLGPKEVWEARARQLRCLRFARRTTEALEMVATYSDREAWQHWLFAHEVVLSYAEVDPVRALELARWAAEVPAWRRADSTERFGQTIRDLEARVAGGAGR